jgi:predicted deacylase
MEANALVIEERRGAEPGPLVALLGGVHGDEEEGVLAVQRVLSDLDGRVLRRGAVRAVAVAHPAAYAAERRTSPLDGGDLARSFPGAPTGTPTERLASTLTREVIAGADFLIDLHSAGRHYAMPFFCGFTATPGALGDQARRGALAFGAPLVWAHDPPPPPGRTVSAAYERGIPSVYVEGAGGGRLRSDEVDAYVAGVLAILAELGLCEPHRAADLTNH